MYWREYAPNTCGATEELDQGFFVWLGPAEFCRCSLWCIQEYLPCFIVLPEKWHRVGLLQKLLIRFFNLFLKNRTHKYLPVDMQNHILNRAMLLYQSQSPLWAQPAYFFAVVAAQQNTQVNKLVGKKWKKDKRVNKREKDKHSFCE